MCGSPYTGSLFGFESHLIWGVCVCVCTPVHTMGAGEHFHEGYISEQW